MFRDLPPIIVLAGGQGTRLLHLNLGVPKLMVKFNGKPFLDWKLESLARQGFKKVILALGAGSTEVVRHLEDSGSFEALNIQVETVFDPFTACGTGLAVLNAFPAICEEVFVTYGDNLTFVDPFMMLEEGIRNHASVISMESSNRADLKNGNLTFLEEPYVLYDSSSERMKFVDHGMLLMRKEDLELAPLGIDGSESLPLGKVLFQISKENRLCGVISQADYLEFGNDSSYKHAIDEFGRYYSRYVR